MPRVAVNLPEPRMYIRSLKVEGFKSLEQVEIHFNPDLNVLTGVNNSGKTTVLEAIALWVECFRKLVRKNSDKRSRRTAYLLGQEGRFSFSEFTSVRCPDYRDMFLNLNTDIPIKIDAAVTDGENEMTIGFAIEHEGGGHYLVEFLPTSGYTLQTFNDFFTKLPNPFSVIYASPVATLPPREEFQTPPKVRAEVNARQSMRVLRNRLYQLRKDAARYHDFVNSVAKVLCGDDQNVHFEMGGDETEDVDLSVKVQIGQELHKNISLLGSGTLQIIEIMLSLYADKSDLNLVLLDEPDSHIHRDIQRRLYRKLLEHSNNTQIFLTTHNESLIRSTRVEHLFHLEPQTKKTYYPVYKDGVSGQKQGLQPSRYLKILKTLGSETSIDFLNALEAERLVLVEGEDDARFIHTIVEGQMSPSPPFAAMYWSFDGVDTIFERIDVYRDIFSRFRNDTTLWEKAVLVIDRDHMTDEQRAALQSKLTQKLSIPVYISTSYTMEATILSEPSKLGMLLKQLFSKESNRKADLAAVDSHLATAIDALTLELEKRIVDPDFLKGLFYRLKSRREKLERLGIRDVITTTDGSLQTEFQTFAKDALARRQVHLLATKDDISNLIKTVHDAAGIPFDKERLFERLLDCASMLSWFDEWKELRKAVK